MLSEIASSPEPVLSIVEGAPRNDPFRTVSYLIMKDSLQLLRRTDQKKEIRMQRVSLSLPIYNTSMEKLQQMTRWAEEAKF